MGFMNGRGSYQYNDWDMVESGVENEEKMETDRHNNSLTMDETVVNGGEDIKKLKTIAAFLPEKRLVRMWWLTLAASSCRRRAPLWWRPRVMWINTWRA